MKKILKLGVSVFCFYFCLSFFNTAAQSAREPEVLGRVISMDFQDARLKDLLKVFSIQSGLNFVASEALQDRTVTLYLDNVPLDKVMDKIFKANNLSYELDKESNIFVVKDWGKNEVEAVTKVFYLKYATVSSSSLKQEMSKYTTVAGEISMGNAQTGANSAGTGGKWKAEDESGITYAVKKLLSPSGLLIEDFRTNSLIVTDTPKKIEVISKVITALDVSVPQVLLEVEMLDVSKNAIDQIGVNWPTNVASLIVPGTRLTKFPFGDKGTSGRGYIIDPDKGAFDAPGWDMGAWNAAKFGPSVLTAIGTTLTLDFLRTQTDTKYLARPRIITLSNETAEIRIATNEAIGIKQTTTSSDESSTTTVEAERSDTGIILRVTPQVNLETGEITMFVYPRVADSTASSLTGTGVTVQYMNPEERSTKSVVKVKDGETIVLGGLIRTERQKSISKLPVLGDIPLIGALFRHENKTKDIERELLIFITSHIVKENNPQLVQQAKAITMPVREQGVDAGFYRKAVISASLNNFEKK